jgi:Transposase IS200 like
MPNHLHAIVDVWQTPLSVLTKKWKGASSRLANRVLGRSGQFWQEDYWDTLMRDADHLARAVRYVENNPTKARLMRDPKAWPWGSARLRDEIWEVAVSGCGLKSALVRGAEGRSAEFIPQRPAAITADVAPGGLKSALRLLATIPHFAATSTTASICL